MTYLAINHGAKGLIYYSYFNIRDDTEEIYPGNSYDVRWAQIKEIANEIHQLRPVLLSTDTINISVLCSNGDIDFTLLKQNRFYYLIAFHRHKIPQRGCQNDGLPGHGISGRILEAHRDG